MNIIIKLLPIILISLIFYVLTNNLYPKYQETIGLVKKLNELKNKEKDLKDLENLIQSLNQNPNIQQLISQKDSLNIWLPKDPKIEEIINSLNALHQSLGIIFKGVDLTISNETKSFNENILPFKVINFRISTNLSEDKIIPFVEFLEKNARLMLIKKAVFYDSGLADLNVESYYLPAR